MRIAQVQFAQWDRKYDFDASEAEIISGDYVVVKTESGIELGKVVRIEDARETKDKNATGLADNEIGTILRKADASDFKKIPDEKQKMKDFAYCKKAIERYRLPMKLVDVHYSFDDSKIVFPFIADSRIDFRELVKDLTNYFNKNIRLQQIGIRDEARFCGGFGHCGRPLCCAQFLSDLNSITSEMAELQQCAHRGSERISGVCGRLMCCLSYESDGYRKLADSLPAIDSKVKVEGKKGRVVARNILRQTVKVALDENNGEDGNMVEAEISQIKKL